MGRRIRVMVLLVLACGLLWAPVARAQSSGSFTSVKREGIELTSGFTATVNGELRVGALEETITVSGASPVVDTHNVRSQTTLTRDVLDTIPTMKTQQGYAAFARRQCRR